MTHTNNQRGRTLATLIVVALCVCAGTPAVAQTFSSGSDGSDGALTIAASQGTIIFDPRDTARWGRVLDPEVDVGEPSHNHDRSWHSSAGRGSGFRRLCGRRGRIHQYCSYRDGRRRSRRRCRRRHFMFWQ
jgi:hypothetical protein